VVLDTLSPAERLAFVRPALINCAAGVVAFDGDTPFAILAFVIVDGRAHSIDVFDDRELVPRLVGPGACSSERL
jgi:hypothetical protein